MSLRTSSFAAGLALATSALVLTPVPAQAAAISSGTFQVSRSVNEVGPANCNVTNPSSGSTTSFNSDGVTVTQTASGTTTLVDTADASDSSSITSSVTSKLRATESGGSLASLDLATSQSATLTINQGAGTDCDAQVSLGAAASSSATLAVAKWVTVDAELPLGTGLTLVFQRTSPSTPFVYQVIVLTGSQKGRAHAEFFLPAGTYTNTLVTSTQWTGPQAAGDPTTFSSKPHARIDLLPVGTAKNKATGSGTKYLKLNNSRKCSKDQLQGKFTAAAGTAATAKISKVTFKVNGKKSKVVKLPERNQKVTLTDLPSDQDVTVSAVIKLFGGGKAKLSRDYRSCT